MNTIKNILAISALAMGTLTPMGSFAQTMMDHGKMDMSQASASMTDGEIKKVGHNVFLCAPSNVNVTYTEEERKVSAEMPWLKK